MRSGKVYLVGAGPGDPGLLTIKGLRALESADVVVYDHLVNRTLLDAAPEHVELIYAGKEPGGHGVAQEEINRLLAERAQSGCVVVRLKGGDPFIFGRGGEEAEFLASQGIPFEIVPGVTSAVAVPAYAGIPLTYRDLSSSVVFVTGHKDLPGRRTAVQWDTIAKGADTLVILMGVTNLSSITSKLIRYGRSPDEPAAVVAWGTTAEQQVVTGTLTTIAGEVARRGIVPPGVVVVGRVAALRDRMAWYEALPLSGKRVIVTRPKHQAARLGALLESAGAEVRYLPTIALAPPQSWAAADDAIDTISSFDWIIFTSANGVEQLLRRLAHHRKDVRAMAGAKIAAVGSETAETLRRSGIEPDLVPERYESEGLVAAFRGELRRGQRVLLPAAAGARELLPRELTRLGATVVNAPVYQTVPVSKGGEALRRQLQAGRIHLVTFASPSAVKSFMAMLGDDGARLLKGVIIAAIGPTTAESVSSVGLEVDVLPSASTAPALAAAIIDHVSAKRERDARPPDR